MALVAMNGCGGERREINENKAIKQLGSVT